MKGKNYGANPEKTVKAIPISYLLRISAYANVNFGTQKEKPSKRLILKK